MSQVTRLIGDDPLLWSVLEHVRELELPDCWVAAGFVRNAVWTHLHGRSPTLPDDVDVIWFGPDRISAGFDREAETRLRKMNPTVNWSVTAFSAKVGTGFPFENTLKQKLTAVLRFNKSENCCTPSLTFCLGFCRDFVD